MACGDFVLAANSQRGDRCAGPNGTWTCPSGCVATGDSALDCRQLNALNRCQDAACAASAAPSAAPSASPSVAQAGGSRTAGRLVPFEELPLVVKGSHILGRSQRRHRLACVNWYGAHMEMLVNNGLNVKGLAEIAEDIVALGAFNCVRMPYSLDSLNLSANDIPHRYTSLCHNPELQASSPLEIFDATVKAVTDAGLLVVLNNHVFHRGWCCSGDDGEGLWYTDGFPEAAWLNHLSFMSRRYKDNPRVVGFDIRNEIRSTAAVTPSWGTGDAASDWALAAAKGSRRVLQEDPDMLVIVSGLEYSMYLCRVPSFPLHLQPEFRSHIIYTSHEYEWYLSPPQFLHERVQNFALGFLCSLALGLLVCGVSAALLQRFPERFQRWSACKAGRLRACRRCPRCSVTVQVLAAVFSMTMFYALLFWLGRIFPDPCGQSDFWAAIVFFILYLPGFFLSLRLPWLILLELWPGPPSPADPECGIPPQLSCGGRRVVLGADEAVAIEMSELNEPGPPERNPSGEGDGDAGHVEVDELQPVAAGPKSRPRINRARVGIISLGLVFVSALNGAGILYLQSYEVWRQHLDDRWGFLLHESRDNEADAAAVWLGEFGTATDSLWWKRIMRYMSEKPMAGWAYWPLNGEKRPDERETYGIFKDDMRTVRHPWKLQALQQLFRAATDG